MGLNADRLGPVASLFEAASAAVQVLHKNARVNVMAHVVSEEDVHSAHQGTVLGCLNFHDPVLVRWKRERYLGCTSDDFGSSRPGCDVLLKELSCQSRKPWRCRRLVFIPLGQVLHQVLGRVVLVFHH